MFSRISTYPLLSAIALVLLILLQFIKRSFGKDKTPMSVVIKWGRDKITIPLPPQDSKLEVLRAAVAEATSLPKDSFKLIYHGAIMKDGAPISAYDIRENSTITVIGGGERPPQRQHEPPVVKTETSTISQIHSELDKIRSTLLPSIESFLKDIAPVVLPPTLTATAANPTPTRVSQPSSTPSTRSLEKEHSRLAELLLQSLLRLDGITTDGDWEEARRERKSAVKEVQTLLDQVDDSWRTRPDNLRA